MTAASVSRELFALQKAIRVIRAFGQPQFKFNAVRNVFTRVEHKRSLHGDANDKITLNSRK